MADITKSPWIMHYNGSSFNGCDIEVLACLTPLYDMERFGIINTGNPKHRGEDSESSKAREWL